MNLLTGDGRWWGLRALLCRPRRRSVLPKLIGENGRTMAGGSLKRIREKEERGEKRREGDGYIGKDGKTIYFGEKFQNEPASREHGRGWRRGFGESFDLSSSGRDPHAQTHRPAQAIIIIVIIIMGRGGKKWGRSKPSLHPGRAW